MCACIYARFFFVCVCVRVCVCVCACVRACVHTHVRVWGCVRAASIDELRTQICTEELVDDIVARMNGLRQSTDVQEAGCWALANLVTGTL